MKRRQRGWLFWAPRILCILVAIFLSIFALDVFSEGYSPLDTVVALFMHLVPTWIVLIILAISWRWEWVGSILFVGLAIVYIIIFWEPDNWPAYAMISGPLFLTGILFWLSWRQRVRSRATA